jgi:hypothetical protein
LLPQQPVGFSSVQPARCHPGWAPTPLSLPVGTRVFLIWTTGATPFPVFKGPFAYWKAQTYHLQRGTALPHPQPPGLITLKKKKNNSSYEQSFHLELMGWHITLTEFWKKNNASKSNWNTGPAAGFRKQTQSAGCSLKLVTINKMPW